MLAAGLEHFRAGDYPAAAILLERARAADPGDLDVALLLGISLYRSKRPGEAAPHLRAAAAATDEETRASAGIFLGLIAAERGQSDEADRLLARAASSSSPQLAASGRELRRLEEPHRLLLTFLVRPEFDSNVPILPGLTAATVAATDRADGDVLLLSSVSFRPMPRIGLSIEESLSYRQQLRLTAWSLLANTAGFRYRYLAAHDRVALGYDFETLVLGGSLLSLGHVAQAGYRRSLTEQLGISAHYAFRYRSYYQGAYTAFDGPSHTGLVELGWGTAESRAELAAGAVVVREAAADPSYSATGAGGRLRARVRIGSRTELAATSWLIYRAFDGASPPVGASVRDDLGLYAEISVGVDLRAWLGFIAGVSALRNFSSVADFDYLKLTAHAGLVIGWAGL